MATRETLVSSALSIELTQTEDEVRLEWRGRSDEREPDRFLAPLMVKALELAEAGRRLLVMDFGLVEYMNSSSFTPLVKMLDQAAKGSYRVALEYSRARKWQALSFSALEAFTTGDGRISVHAK